MDELKPILLLIFSGLIIRFALTVTGQAWARSHSQTVTFMLLQIITYVITKTISGNIALSLGMIGALSIVRFRHPVKSALELVIYFDLITIGIATSVRTKWAIQLILCTVLILFLVKVIQSILKKYNKSFYSLSFNEGVSLNILEVESKNKIDIIEKSENLQNIIIQEDTKEFIYRLGFVSKEALRIFKNNLEKESEIKRINVIFN